MLVVGIVTELRDPPGIYGRAMPLDDTVMDWVKAAYLASASQGMTLTLSAAAMREAPKSVLQQVAQYMAVPAVMFGAGPWVYKKLLAPPPPLRRLADPPQPVPPPPESLAAPTRYGGWFGLGGSARRQTAPDPAGAAGPTGRLSGPIDKAMVIPASLLQGTFRGYRDKKLYGMFATRRRFRALMTAEGGNVDLWIISQAMAQQSYAHFTGEAGLFSTGLHVPHPKDPELLVPLEGLADALLNEVRQEWVRAFQMLGAKEIVIADATEREVRAKAKQPVHGIPVAEELRAKYGTGRVEVYTYAPGTFDPSRATANARWIPDYPNIMQVIHARTHGQLTAYRNEETVDASFGLDVEALGVFHLGAQGKFRRRFVIAVAFYERDA